MYLWRDTYEEFMHALDDAKTYEQAWWEEQASAYMVENKESDRLNATLWSRSMAARFPKKYRESTKTEITGAVGTTVPYVQFTPAGVLGTGNVGSVQINVSETIIPTGVQGLGSVGSVTLVYNGGATPTGVVGTGSVGTAVAKVIKTLIGVQGTGQVGTVSVKVSDTVIPVGVQGTGQIGTVFIRGWTVINDSLSS